jgi:hypothetical protein
LSLPYHLRPGAGFVVWVLTLAGALAFFGWGVRTPPLERLWRLQLELSHGARPPLSPAEFSLLDGALQRHPELATDWLEGAPVRLLGADTLGRVERGHAWVLVDRGQADAAVWVLAASGTEVWIRDATARRSAKVEGGQRVRLSLPGATTHPRLLEIGAEGSGVLQLQVEAAP